MKLTVGGQVDFVRQLGDIDVKPVLDLVQDLCIPFFTYERDGQTLKPNKFQQSTLD